eukprot:scaffold40014_cov199-Amphora_coffeaeformis.AAC.2
MTVSSMDLSPATSVWETWLALTCSMPCELKSKAKREIEQAVRWKKRMMHFATACATYAPRKGGRHDKDRIVTPNVGRQVGFGRIQNGWNVFKFGHGRVNVGRFGKDIDSIRQGTFFQIADNQSELVRGNELITTKGCYGMRGVDCFRAGLVSTHADDEFGRCHDSGIVGDFLRWRVHHGRPIAAKVHLTE